MKVATVNMRYDDLSDVLYIQWGEQTPVVTAEERRCLIRRDEDGELIGVTILDYRRSTNEK